MPENSKPQADKDSVTQPTVVSGLGFPLGRNEESPEPTGWQIPVGSTGETTQI
ncbi:MAG: hypothetical protein ACKOWJ_03020 [Micrococcales bacterium]